MENTRTLVRVDNPGDISFAGDLRLIEPGIILFEPSVSLIYAAQ